MKDIIAWEWRLRLRPLLWWTMGSVVLTVVILAVYPSIRDQAQQLDQVINQLPAGLRGLKTGSSGTVDVGDPAGFLNSQLYYATLPIIWIILAITRGAALLGKEESSHTLELLLARPISRSRLLAAKAVELTLELFAVGGATLVVILALAPLFDLHLGSWHLTLATLYTILFSLSFGYIAFALQAASRLTKRTATAVAVGIGFGGYVLASLSSLTDWLTTIVKFDPYHYFTPLDALGGGTPRGLLVYLALVAVAGSLAAWLGFRARDIE